MKIAFLCEPLPLRDSASKLFSEQGRTPEELEESFRASVDFYLERCQRDGVSPQQPYSGRFNIRIRPEIHRCIAERAAQEHVSINQWVSEAVTQVLDQ